MKEAILKAFADSGASVVVEITGVCGIHQTGPGTDKASGIDLFMPNGLFPRGSCREPALTIPIHVPFLRIDCGRVSNPTGSLPRFVRESEGEKFEFYSLLGRKVEVLGVTAAAGSGTPCNLLSVTGTCDSRKYSAGEHPNSHMLSARVKLPPGVVTTSEPAIDYETQDDHNTGKMKHVSGARMAFVPYQFASAKHAITVKAASLVPGAEPEASLTIEPDADKQIVITFAQATEGDILGTSMEMGGIDVHIELMFDLLAGDDKRHVHTLVGKELAAKHPPGYWPKGTNCPPIMLR